MRLVVASPTHIGHDHFTGSKRFLVSRMFEVAIQPGLIRRMATVIDMDDRGRPAAVGQSYRDNLVFVVPVLDDSFAHDRPR